MTQPKPRKKSAMRATVKNGRRYWMMTDPVSMRAHKMTELESLFAKQWMNMLAKAIQRYGDKTPAFRKWEKTAAARWQKNAQIKMQLEMKKYDQKKSQKEWT